MLKNETSAHDGTISGYVDGIAGGALFGWVANLDRPQRLEQVIVRGQNGLSRACQAFMPRRDVNVALSLPGRFGFAIPLEMLHGLGPVVRVTDVTGAALGQGDAVILPPPGAPGPIPSHWLVLHIQKTAGTSLRSALASGVAPGRAAFVYGDGYTGISPAELAAMPAPQRAAMRLVMGHIYYGLVEESLPGRKQYVTILREPLARLRSHYHHHTRGGTVFSVEGPRKDAAAVANGGLTDEFDNLMVRMVSGLGTDDVELGRIDETHVEQALQNIRSDFRFVALTELMDEHLPRLCAAMGIATPALARENVGDTEGQVAAASLVDWDAVMWRNRFDVLLYDRVRQEGLCGHDLAAVAGVCPPS